MKYPAVSITPLTPPPFLQVNIQNKMHVMYIMYIMYTLYTIHCI